MSDKPKERTRATGKQRRQWRTGMRHCEEKNYRQAISVLTDLLNQELPSTERTLIRSAHWNLADAYTALGNYNMAVTHSALAINYCGPMDDRSKSCIQQNLENLLTDHPEIPRPHIL